MPGAGKPSTIKKSPLNPNPLICVCVCCLGGGAVYKTISRIRSPLEQDRGPSLAGTGHGDGPLGDLTAFAPRSLDRSCVLQPSFAEESLLGSGFLDTKLLRSASARDPLQMPHTPPAPAAADLPPEPPSSEAAPLLCPKTGLSLRGLKDVPPGAVAKPPRMPNPNAGGSVPDGFETNGLRVMFSFLSHASRGADCTEISMAREGSPGSN